MIAFFGPSGKCLDPCRGDGVFFDRLPVNGREWCEITEGRDFLAWRGAYDWVIGNPPYSESAKFTYHAMEIGANILFLLPCDKLFISDKMLKTMRKWGFPRHMRVYGPGNRIGFPIGFAVGAMHLEKGWGGAMSFSFAEPR